MKKYILSLDQGTTSSRSIIFDKESNIVGMSQKELTQYYTKPGWVEHDPMEIMFTQLKTVKDVLNKTKVKATDIAAVGIANQRETTVLWDKYSGKPVYNAIVWQCRRTANYCKHIKKDKINKYIQNNTGLVVDAYFSATKIKWILDNVEGARKKAEAGELLFGTIDTWIMWNISNGKIHSTDYSNASRTMLFNINNLRWDEYILEYLDIPANILPKVENSSCIYGKTNQERFFGMSLPIAGVAGDQQSALFGQTCFNEGEAKNTYGTGSFILLNTGNKKCVSKNKLITTIAWGLENNITYALEGSVFNAGSSVQWIKDELGIINTSEESEEYAYQVDDTNGVYMVPAFTGLGAPYWDMYARGTIVGITRGTTKQHITRAVLESIAYQIKDIIEAMEDDSKIKLKELKVDGGGSSNNFLMQFQSDILKVIVNKALINETTALGAAYLAGLATGIYKDIDDIKKNSSKYKKYYPQMKDEKINKIYKKWKDAVNRSMNWIE